MQDIIQLVGDIDDAQRIINDAPEFIRNSISKNETMYNPRTKKYIERGPQSVLIQSDCENDYFHSTMPYHSSFYKECVKLSDLRKALADYKAL